MRFIKSLFKKKRPPSGKRGLLKYTQSWGTKIKKIHIARVETKPYWINICAV